MPVVDYKKQVFALGRNCTLRQTGIDIAFHFNRDDRIRLTSRGKRGLHRCFMEIPSENLGEVIEQLEKIRLENVRKLHGDDHRRKSWCTAVDKTKDMYVKCENGQVLGPYSDYEDAANDADRVQGIIVNLN